MSDTIGTFETVKARFSDLLVRLVPHVVAGLEDRDAPDAGTPLRAAWIALGDEIIARALWTRERMRDPIRARSFASFVKTKVHEMGGVAAAEAFLDRFVDEAILRDALRTFLRASLAFADRHGVTCERTVSTRAHRDGALVALTDRFLRSILERPIDAIAPIVERLTEDERIMFTEMVAILAENASDPYETTPPAVSNGSTN